MAGPGIPFGEYRLLRRLGAGGMAEVFLAKRSGPKGFEKQLVIKRILPHLSTDPHFRDLFLREAQIAALIDHPNLAHVSGFGEIDGSYYLAMEYVDGITVSELLKIVGALPPGVATRIGIDLLAALHAVSTARSAEGEALELVHRDVSSRNVMLARDGTVKLLDLGIAIESHSAPSERMGTKRYMSPEQKRRARLDSRSDLYSAALLIVELIAGSLPAVSDSGALPERPEAVPPELWETLSSALQPDPRDRPESPQAMQRALELFVATCGIEGTRAHLTERIGALSARRSPVRRALSRLTRMTEIRESGNAATRGRRLTAEVIGVFVALTIGSMAATAFYFRGGGPEAVPREIPALSGHTTAASTVADSEFLARQDPAVTRALEAPSMIATATPTATGVERSTPSRRRAFGRLTIDTEPWTEVYLGGKKLGVTPMEGVRVPSGPLDLELRNAKLGVRKKMRVMITPGRTTRVRRAL